MLFHRVYRRLRRIFSLKGHTRTRNYQSYLLSKCVRIYCYRVLSVVVSSQLPAAACTADYSCAYKRKACTAAPQLTRRSSVCCFTLSGGRATAVLRADTFSGGRAYILLSKGRGCCPLATLTATCCPNVYAFIATACRRLLITNAYSV